MFKYLSLVILSLGLCKPVYGEHKIRGVRNDNSGNLLEHSLEHTLDIIRKSLKKLKVDRFARVIINNYCNTRWRYSDPDKPDAKLNLCTDFLISTADEMLKVISQRPIPELRAIVPSDPEEFMFISRINGSRKEADAYTSHKPDSPIIYNYLRVREFEYKDLILITYHELGHKVKFRGKYLNDDAVVDGLGTERDLLNAAGYALYRYAWRNKIIDYQKGQYTNPKKDHFNCEITDSDNDSRVISEFVTKQPKVYFPGRRAYNTGIGIGKSYGYEITEVTSQFFPGERVYFSLRVHEEDSCKNIGSYDNRSVKMMLTSRVVGEKDLIKVEPYDPDSFCKKNPTFFKISYHNLTISCLYLGYYLD